MAIKEVLPKDLYHDVMQCEDFTCVFDDVEANEGKPYDASIANTWLVCARGGSGQNASKQAQVVHFSSEKQPSKERFRRPSRNPAEVDVYSEDYATIKEAAYIYEVSISTIKKWIKSEGIVSVGKRDRADVYPLEALLDAKHKHIGYKVPSMQEMLKHLPELFSGNFR